MRKECSKRDKAYKAKVLPELATLHGALAPPDVFDESIFSFRRITLAPTVVLAGYGVIVYAILKKS